MKKLLKLTMLALIALLCMTAFAACDLFGGGNTNEPETYTLTFDSNGGSAVAPITQDEGTQIEKPTDPTFGNKVFGGWYPYWDTNFTEEVIFPFTIEEDYELQAKWFDLLDFENVTFENKTVTYDGQEHTVTVSGVQDGTNIEYVNNKATNAGVYNAEAVVSEGGYNIKTLNATLVINKADITGVTFTNAAFVADGSKKNIEVSGTLPQGVNVEYGINNATFTGASEIGTYKITATLSGENYNTLTLSAKLYIIEENTATVGLAFTPINNDTEYSVSKGNATAAEVVIPWFFNGKPVTQIAREAFRDSLLLTGITIPASVNTIGILAFSGCLNLTDIIIPENVTTIGGRAFESCEGLTDITIPASVTNIDNTAFNSCTNLTGITVASDNPNYSSQDGILYNKTKTKIIKIPQTVTGNLTLLDSVTDINRFTVIDCAGLTSITAVNNPNYSSQDGILYNKAKTVIVAVPKGIKGISGDITLANGVTSIAQATFDECNNLTSITIPASVTSIQFDAFRDCAGLMSIVVSSNNTNYSSQDGILYNKTKTEIIKVPQKISGAIILPESVTSIAIGCFSRCTDITSIVIYDNVNFIGNSAIIGCTSLTDIYYTGTQTQWQAIDKTAISLQAGITIHYDYTA